MAPYIDKYDYKMTYFGMFGGVVAFHKKDFLKVSLFNLFYIICVFRCIAFEFIVFHKMAEMSSQIF